MSYKPDDNDWMAYLYGEMEEADKRNFEEFVLRHPEARLELERFQGLRDLMAKVEDKEVIAPPIVFGDNTSAGGGAARRGFWHTGAFRLVTAVAASLLLVIVVGKLTGVQITVSGQEFRLTFGAMPQQEPRQMPPEVTTEQVKEMITASLEKHNTVVQASLDETRRKLDASIRTNLALNSGKIDQLVREASLASQQQIRQYVDGIRSENMEQVKDYFQLTSTEQKKYIENLLVDFAKYLQQQRNNDLQLVQTRMSSLEKNTDIFRQETEQILSSIITSVGTPVSGETKN